MRSFWVKNEVKVFAPAAGREAAAVVENRRKSRRIPEKVKREVSERARPQLLVVMIRHG